MGGRSLRTGGLEHAARAAAAGDRAAFAALCAAVQSDVWRYCWAILGQHNLADDAAQRTLDRTATAIRRYRGDIPVKVWICSVARHICFEQRRQWHTTPIPVDAVSPSPVGSAPRDTVDAMSLLELLDESRREAFVLTQLIGLSYNDTARVAEVSVATIRSQVHEARNILAAAWLEHTASSDQAPTVTKRPKGTR